MEFDDLSDRVIGCAIEVHRKLGPGLLESTYEQCLAHELWRNVISFQLQYPQPVKCKDIRLDCGYRIDILVDNITDPRTQERRGDQWHLRGPTIDVHEIGWRESWIADQLQEHEAKGWHPAFRTLIPSCSSCPSW